MRSMVALVAAVILVLAACGGSDQLETIAAPGLGRSSSPSATTRDAPEDTAREDTQTNVAGDSGTAGALVSEIDVERFPIVVGAAAAAAGDNRWRFDVTVSSPYDTPERYADGWRVLDQADNELGVRVLAHDHANEQPFTRSATIDVRPDTSVVFVEGRDLHNGWSGQRFELVLDTP